jgi:hypothetical protein
MYVRSLQIWVQAVDTCLELWLAFAEFYLTLMSLMMQIIDNDLLAARLANTNTITKCKGSRI